MTKIWPRKQGLSWPGCGETGGIDIMGIKIRILLLFIGFSILGGILYVNTLDNGFTFDDAHVILQNEGIRHASRLIDIWSNTMHPGDDPVMAIHYRPMVYTSYMLSYAISGLDPFGYHMLSILIHILTAFLTALVLYRLTGRTSVGVLAGLLFLVHPFNAEAVNYVTARSSQLYAMFYLLAFYAYLRYRLSSRSSNSYLWLVLSLISFVLSMLSKELAVTFPLAILLYEWFLGPAAGWRDHLRRLQVPAGIGVVVVISYLAIRKVMLGAVLAPTVGRDLVKQLATESVVLVRTIGLILWPANLTIDHQAEVYKTFAAWPVALACLVLVGLLGLILWWVSTGDITKRTYAFLLAWFFMALSPLAVIQLYTVLQENRAYLAIVGIVGLEATGLVRLLDWTRHRIHSLWWGVCAGTVTLILIYGALTIQRNIVWQDDISLWGDAVQKEPYSALSREILGTAYSRLGQLDQAFEQFHRAWIINPTDPEAVFNVGLILEKQGRLNDAGLWYGAAFRLNSGFYAALLQVGKKGTEEGRLDDAIHVYKRAVLMWPDGIEGHRLLADALVHLGRVNEAMTEYEALLQKGISDQRVAGEVRNKLARLQGNSRDLKKDLQVK
ncbi:MAG: tetratricopeptide repeat protein [Nitrospirae bacterium]|nr:tetratricopeptide repeat protein [Nitrospirota bacterium]